MRPWMMSAVLLAGCGLTMELEPEPDASSVRSDAGVRPGDASRPPPDGGARDAGQDAGPTVPMDAGPPPPAPTVLSGRFFSVGVPALDATDGPPMPIPWPVDHLKVQLSEHMVEADFVVTLYTGDGVVLPTRLNPVRAGAEQWLEVLLADTAATLGRGYFCLELIATPSERGVLLDGEWSGAFPSGDGMAGGDFHYVFAVLPGDANRNGEVDAADYTVVIDHYGSYLDEADLDGNGVVDGSDYLEWQRLFGDSLDGAPSFDGCRPM